MKTKIAPEMTVLSYELKTNMTSLLDDVGNIPQEIYFEASNSKFIPAGPMYWIYTWESQDPTADFILKITLPVATMGSEYSGEKYKFEKIGSYKCLTTEHLGSWDKLKDSYEQIMEKIKTDSLMPGNTSREVYINCDFENVQNNVTEIQFGIN